jgi:hypothetical protein
MKELKSFLNESLSIDERYLEKMYLRKSTLPQDVIKTHLVEAFKYMWDEQGKTISSIEFNTLIEDVISKYDISELYNEGKYLDKMYLRKIATPEDVIKTHLVEAFIFILDEQGKELNTNEFNYMVIEVLRKFDIRKELSWGNIIPEK